MEYRSSFKINAPYFTAYGAQTGPPQNFQGFTLLCERYQHSDDSMYHFRLSGGLKVEACARLPGC